MTTYRHTTPDAEAAQYQPTAEAPLTFDNRPEWLDDAIETNRIVVRPQADDELPALALQAHRSVELVAPNDFIIRNRWGHIYSLPPALFLRDFEPFDADGTPAAAPTTTPAPTVTTGATA